MTEAILHPNVCLMSHRERAGYKGEKGINVAKKKKKKRKNQKLNLAFGSINFSPSNLSKI